MAIYEPLNYLIDATRPHPEAFKLLLSELGKDDNDSGQPSVWPSAPYHYGMGRMRA